MLNNATIAVDFDGVIHSYTSGWKGYEVIPDIPVPGAIVWLVSLMQSFSRVVIVSSRAATVEGVQAIREWLNFYASAEQQAALENLEITHGKVPAKVYIDDRAFRFEGIFPTIQELAEFEPWKPPSLRQVPIETAEDAMLQRGEP